MKKLQFFLILMTSVIITSCVDSDDVKKVEDPVFEAKYTPLQDLSDVISEKTWKYQGSKVGKRKFGKISPDNCLANNILFLHEGKLTYKSNAISIETKSCKEKYRRIFESAELKSEGALSVAVKGEKLSKVLDTVTKVMVDGYVKDPSYKPFAGEIEIGFQAGMLRIEDKFSGYNGNEKVYVYFK